MLCYSIVTNRYAVHCCSAIGIVIVLLLITILCYRYSDSSITNRYAVHCCSYRYSDSSITTRSLYSAIGIVIVVLQ